MRFGNAPDTAFGQPIGEIERDGGIHDHARIHVLCVGAVAREILTTEGPHLPAEVVASAGRDFVEVIRMVSS